MSTRRRYCRVAVLGNCIYALGGFDSSNYQSSVERYDPRIGHWMAMPPMTSRYVAHKLSTYGQLDKFSQSLPRRSSCGVAALEYLYCIGGSDGTMCMSSGERFNLRTNSWEPISSMNSRRSTHEVVEAGTFLYALGESTYSISPQSDSRSH